MPASTAGDHRAPQPIHARAETVTELPMFAEAFRKRRAIVPATAYFQHSTRGTLAQRYAICRRDGQPLAIAGLWEAFVAPGGEIVRTYSIITAVHMQARGFGRIVNISSEQAYTGYADLAHYTAAKGGLRTLTKSLALALGPAITVNTVCPGPTATEKFKAGPEYRPDIRDQIVLKRWVEPHDVGRSVVFLASDDGAAYTGQTLDPNCGTVMW